MTDLSGPWAIATAAGKDATLALLRARMAGMEVRWALNVFEGSSGLVRFHGTPRVLVERYSAALGLSGRFAQTEPPGAGEERPRRSFETAFRGLLTDLRREGARGIIFGNLHLEEIRSWYEERVEAAGLLHHEPLWMIPPAEVSRAVVDEGFRATVVSVNRELGSIGWLGRELTTELIEEFVAVGIDPAGEHGEYHTFVHDGPGFSRAVPFRVVGESEREGHRYLELAEPRSDTLDTTP